MTNVEIGTKVNELCSLKRQIEELKAESERLEGELLKQAQTDLENTKEKTVKYFGSGSNHVVASTAVTTKIVYPSILQNVLGTVFKDAVKTEVKYSMTAPVKRMLAGMYLGEYTKTSMKEIFKQITGDVSMQEALAKKCKGVNYNSDKKAIMNIAGLPDCEAEHYAYFLAEAKVWEDFSRAIETSVYKDDIEGAIKSIETAVVAETTPKVEICYEE